MAVSRDRMTKPRYSSRIIKAGALIPDTRSILLGWDLEASPKQNLAAVLERNTLGKASRSRVIDQLKTFRQRYFYKPEVARALAIIVKGGWSEAAINRVLFYFTARADPLVRDIVLELVGPMHHRGRLTLQTADVEEQIRLWVLDGRTVSPWSEATVCRAAQGVMATLRDFGLLAGVVAKRITPPHMPSEAAALITFMLTAAGTSASRVTSDPVWALFLLEPASVERVLLEAHQHHLLHYHAAGRLARIDFPASTIEEYALALAQGPD